MINGSLKIFTENGYRHASTDEIVSEAGISKGLLFHYFINKIGLFSFLYEYSTRFVLLELHEEFRRPETDYFELQKRLTDAEAAREKIEAYLEEVVAPELSAHLLNSGKELQPDTIQSLLLTSVHNRCVNLLVRKQRSLANVVYLDTENSDKELLDDMYHYIDQQLPPLSQQVLRLRYQQGLKYREIAEELQVSEVTVYNHLSQSLKQLKDHFKSLGYEIK